MRIDKLVFINNRTIVFDDSMSKHTAWLHTHITGHHYPNQSKDSFPREVHGTPDMARCAGLSKIILEMYRRYNDKEAINITERQAKLIQLAADWHDIGREDDGEDYWDDDSAINFYYYLTLTLGLSHDEAKIYAEGIINKDGAKYELQINPISGEAEWIGIKDLREKNIVEKVVHDSDCYDIIRARAIYDARYLDLYQQYYLPEKDKSKKIKIRNEIGHLRNEISSIIEKQGDGWARYNYEIKKKYNVPEAYTLIEKDIKEKKILSKLYYDNQLRDLKSVQEIDLIDPKLLTLEGKENKTPTENFCSYMLNGQLLARGIPWPSFTIKKVKKDGTIETAAELDFRKNHRRKDNNSRQKEGNKNRSCSMLGYAGGVFSSAVGLICVEDAQNIQFGASSDQGTGFGKKKKLPSNSIIKNETSTDDMLTNLAFGGSGWMYGDVYVDAHSEVLYDVEDYHGFAFTQNPCHFNIRTNPEDKGLPINSYAPILQAVYLQQLYKKQTGIQLPIFEYSRFHGTLEERKYTDEEIVTFWTRACSEYMQSQLSLANKNTIVNRSVEDIKILAVYGNIDSTNYDIYNPIYGEPLPADMLYPLGLQKTIDKNIEAEKNRLVAEYNLKQSEKYSNKLGNEAELLSLDAIKYLAGNPSLSHEIKEKYRSLCQQYLVQPFAINDTFVDKIDNSRELLLMKSDNKKIDSWLYGKNGFQYETLKKVFNIKTVKYYFIAKKLGFDDICETIVEKIKSSFLMKSLSECGALTLSIRIIFIELFGLNELKQRDLAEAIELLKHSLEKKQKISFVCQLMLHFEFQNEVFLEHCKLVLEELGFPDDQNIGFCVSMCEKLKCDKELIRSKILKYYTTNSKENMIKIFNMDELKKCHQLFVDYDLWSDKQFFETFLTSACITKNQSIAELSERVSSATKLIQPNKLSEEQFATVFKKISGALDNYAVESQSYSMECQFNIITSKLPENPQRQSYYFCIDKTYPICPVYYIDKNGVIERLKLNTKLSILILELDKNRENLSEAEKLAFKVELIKMRKLTHFSEIIHAVHFYISHYSAENLPHSWLDSFKAEFKENFESIALPDDMAETKNMNMTLEIISKLNLVGNDIEKFLKLLNINLISKSNQYYIQAMKHNNLELNSKFVSTAESSSSPLDSDCNAMLVAAVAKYSTDSIALKKSGAKNTSLEKTQHDFIGYMDSIAHNYSRRQKFDLVLFEELIKIDLNFNRYQQKKLDLLISIFKTNQANLNSVKTTTTTTTTTTVTTTTTTTMMAGMTAPANIDPNNPLFKFEPKLKYENEVKRELNLNQQFQ